MKLVFVGLEFIVEGLADCFLPRRANLVGFRRQRRRLKILFLLLRKFATVRVGGTVVMVLRSDRLIPSSKVSLIGSLWALRTLTLSISLGFKDLEFDLDGSCPLLIIVPLAVGN